jgi:peptide deformylase
MILNIITYPNNFLRQKSKNVDMAEIKQNEFQKFIQDLVKTMRMKDGIGLAAPQVSQSIRVIAVSTENGALILINPKIIGKSWRKNLAEEGCLSFPNIFGMVKRHNKIKVIGYDKNGKQIKLKCEGLFARVIQHEINHLDGILFIDKAKKITKVAELLKSKKDAE